MHCSTSRGHAVRRDLRDHVIERVGAIEHAGVAAQPLDLVHFRVHRVEAVLLVVARLHHRAEEAAAPVFVRRDTDDGRGAGMEDRVKRMLVRRNVAHRGPRF